MAATLVRATYGSPDHPLRIGDLIIPCYVLEDGRRVLHQRGLVSSLGMARGGSSIGRGDRLVNFASGQGMQPYLSEALMAAITNPIKFRTPRGAEAYGYEATILADLCEAILKAREDGKLQKQQEHIAKRCEVLIRGFARVGIIALVDEATGYQAIRDRDALQVILEAYVSKELLPWTARFPDEFYKEMFRLRDWQYTPMNPRKGPRFAGKLTNEIVYDRLPDGVLEELQRKNPVVKHGRRAYKLHQFLTDDIGNPHLEKHLAVVIALMRIAPTWRKFMSMLNRAVPPQKPYQTDLFENDEDDDGE